MRKNNKAFTMIELIATIAIMGIIMLIAVPNILNVIEKNKKTTYINDAKKLISSAKSKYKADTTITEPTENLCVVFRLKDLDNSNLQKGPNNGKYNTTYSYVTINYDKTNQQYIYRVQLLEEYNSSKNTNYRGIAYNSDVTSDNLSKANVTRATSNIDDFTSLSTLGSATSKSCQEGLAYPDGTTSSTVTGPSIGETLTAIFSKGSNVKQVDATSRSCTISAGNNCNIILPSITPEDGFSSNGWSTAKDTTKNGIAPGISITLYKNQTYYANAKDDISPSIKLSEEGDENYTTSKNITVTISDLGVGLKSGAKIKYGWSKSNSVAPTNYENATLKYNEKDKNTSFTAKGTGFNGSYYLWIIPTELNDINNNQQKNSIISEKTFNFNNTNPVCNFETNDKDIFIGNQASFTLSCTDNNAALQEKNLVATDINVSSDNGKITNITGSSRIENGLKYEITVEGIKIGNFKLTLPPGIIKNVYGNSNIDSIESPTINVKGLTYNVKYIKQQNVASIEKESDSCTTTGSNKTCTVTLPSITAVNGYTVNGWSINENTTDYLKAGDSITLDGNKQYYASAKSNNIPPSISLTENASSTYSQIKNVTVNISDEIEGLESGATLRYGWSLTNKDVPNQLFDVEPIYGDGAKNISFEAVGQELTGSYYLWVIPINLSDKAGNNQMNPTISTGTFIFDNEKPTCTFTSSLSELEIQDEMNITLSCTDNQSGLKEKDLSPEDILISSNARIISISSPEAINNGYKYDIKIKAICVGSFYFTLPKDIFIDKVGNTNQESISITYIVEPKTYTITYNKGNNISEIDKVSDSCTTTNANTTCEVILPNIIANTGYSVSGWYNSDNTKMAAPLTKYTLFDDETMTAQAIINSYKVTYDYKTNGGDSVSLSEREFTYNSVIDLSETAKKAGYEFVGWNTDKYATNKLDSLIMGTEDITLYAIYKKDAVATFYYYSGTSQQSINQTCTMYNVDESCQYYSIPQAIENSMGPNSTLYQGLSVSGNSTKIVSNYDSKNLKYYAVYQVPITANFYYYNGTSQALATSIGIRNAVSNGTTYSTNNPNIAVPSNVSESTGPDNGVYKGVSTVINSTTSTTPNTASNNYYAYYQGTWVATYTALSGVSTIGSTMNSCFSNKVSNGTIYTSKSCNVTAPTIEVKNGYLVLGWFDVADKFIANPGDNITLNANATFTAEAEEN